MKSNEIEESKIRRRKKNERKKNENEIKYLKLILILGMIYNKLYNFQVLNFVTEKKRRKKKKKKSQEKRDLRVEFEAQNISFH